MAPPRRSPRLAAMAAKPAAAPVPAALPPVPLAAPAYDLLDDEVQHVSLRYIGAVLNRMAIGASANATVEKCVSPFENIMLVLQVTSDLFTRQIFKDTGNMVQAAKGLKLCVEMAKMCGQAMGAFNDKSLRSIGVVIRSLGELASDPNDSTAFSAERAILLADMDEKFWSLILDSAAIKDQDNSILVADCLGDVVGRATDLPIRIKPEVSLRRPRAPRRRNGRVTKRKTTRTQVVARNGLPAPAQIQPAPAQSVHSRQNPARSSAPSRTARGNQVLPSKTSSALPPANNGAPRTQSTTMPSGAGSVSVAHGVSGSGSVPSPLPVIVPNGSSVVYSTNVPSNTPSNPPSTGSGNGSSGVSGNAPSLSGSRQASFGSPQSSQSSSPSVMETSRTSRASRLSNDSMNSTGTGSYSPIAGSLLVTPPLVDNRNRNASPQQHTRNDTSSSDISVLNLTGSTVSNMSTPRLSAAQNTPSASGTSQNGTPLSRNTSSSTLPSSVQLTGASSADQSQSVRGSASSIGVSPLTLSSMTSSPGTPSAVLLTDSSVGTTASSRSIPRMGNLNVSGSPVATNSPTAAASAVSAAVNSNVQSSDANAANPGPRSVLRNEPRPASSTGIQDVGTVQNPQANRPQSAAGALMRADGHAQFPYHQRPYSPFLRKKFPGGCIHHYIYQGHERSFGASTPRTDDGVSPMQRFARERAAALAAQRANGPAVGSPQQLIPANSALAANLSADFGRSPDASTSGQGRAQGSTGTPVTRKRRASTEGRGEGESEEKRPNSQ